MYYSDASDPVSASNVYIFYIRLWFLIAPRVFTRLFMSYLSRGVFLISALLRLASTDLEASQVPLLEASSLRMIFVDFVIDFQ